MAEPEARGHGARMIGLTAVIVVGMLILSGMLYLVPPGTPRGQFRADFELAHAFCFEAGPIEMEEDLVGGGGRTETVGRFIMIGPLEVEHWTIR